MSKKAKPVFEKRIFWDVDFDKIDYDAKARFVIERVFEPLRQLNPTLYPY